MKKKTTHIKGAGKNVVSLAVYKAINGLNRRPVKIEPLVEEKTPHTVGNMTNLTLYKNNNNIEFPRVSIVELLGRINSYDNSNVVEFDEKDDSDD